MPCAIGEGLGGTRVSGAVCRREHDSGDAVAPVDTDAAGTVTATAVVDGVAVADPPADTDAAGTTTVTATDDPAR